MSFVFDRIHAGIIFEASIQQGFECPCHFQIDAEGRCAMAQYRPTGYIFDEFFGVFEFGSKLFCGKSIDQIMLVTVDAAFVSGVASAKMVSSNRSASLNRNSVVLPSGSVLAI